MYNIVYYIKNKVTTEYKRLQIVQLKIAPKKEFGYLCIPSIISELRVRFFFKNEY